MLLELSLIIVCVGQGLTWVQNYSLTCNAGPSLCSASFLYVGQILKGSLGLALMNVCRGVDGISKEFPVNCERPVAIAADPQNGQKELRAEREPHNLTLNSYLVFTCASYHYLHLPQ